MLIRITPITIIILLSFPSCGPSAWAINSMTALGAMHVRDPCQAHCLATLEPPSSHQLPDSAASRACFLQF